MSHYKNTDPINNTYISKSVTTTVADFDDASFEVLASRPKSIPPQYLTEDNVAEAAQYIENMLQDAFITCTEECCIEINAGIDMVSISQSIVKLLLSTYLLNDKVTELTKTLESLETYAGFLKSQVLENQHASKLQKFKNRKYPEHEVPKNISSKQWGM